MKKLVSVLVITLFAVNYLFAQATETLTNSTIVMMVKAKLSDDLIIDEINNSKTNFNVSSDSIKFLTNQNVSFQVIQIMKAVTGTQTSTATKDTTTQIKETILTGKETSLQLSVQTKDSVKLQEKIQPEPKIELPKESLKEKVKTESVSNDLIDKTSLTVNAISYTMPVEDLMTFFDNEFNILAAVIKGWDQRIRDSIARVNQIKDNILQVEKELADKKNADSKGYSNVILMFKKELSANREKYKKAKTNMFTDGMTIAKECKNISDELDQSINNKFSDISNSVRKVNPEPAKGEITKAITIAKKKFDADIVNYVASATEMLFFCQNEIVSLQEVIVLWNEKALEIIQKDSELSKQLEPLKKELDNYKTDPKKNKKEISELKKQCAKIDKERKQLEDQMVDDSKDLAEYLKKKCAEVQSAAKARFTDIIENINFSYQDKFNIDK